MRDDMSATERWRELQVLGKATFIWRERALFIGLPVGVVYALLFGEVSLGSLQDLLSRTTIVGLWTPLLVSIGVGAVVGVAEWAEAEEKATRESSGKA